MFARKIALLIVLAQLVGCGSGNSDVADRPVRSDPPGPVTTGGSPYAHFEGTWQGMITPDDTLTSSWAVVIVNGWGEFRLMTTDTQFVGAPNRTITTLEGELTGFRSPGTTWSDGSRVSAFAISGTIAEDDFINAAYANGTDSGTLAIAWVADTHSTHIGAIQGTWALFDDVQNIVATFDLSVYDEWSATIAGAHSNGCTFSGEAEAWTSLNSYDIWELNISSCPLIAGIDVNGDYSGTAARLDVPGDGSNELALVVALSNDENQFTYILNKL